MTKAPRTLILHIGWPKTGTTSLQNFFSANRDVMLKQAGILYPRTGIMGFGHQELSLSLIEKAAESSPLWQKLGEELTRGQGYQQALISCEGLQSCEPGRARRLMAALPEFERYVVMAYIRQPDEIRESLFGQDVNDGRFCGSFAEFLETVEKKGKFDYLGRIRRWREILPGAEVIVRPFERAQWVGGDLLQDFCRSLDWPDLTSLEGAELPEDSNRSLGGHMLSLAREINRVLHHHRKQGRGLGFAALHFTLDRCGLRDLDSDPKIDLLGPRQRREMRERYQPEFEQLGVRFLADPPQGDGGEVRDLPEFDELSAERRIELLMLSLRAAVLSIDDLQEAYWRHHRLNSGPDEELRRVEIKAAEWRDKQKESRRQLNALKDEHREVKRENRELRRQLGKTLRGRWLAFKSRRLARRSDERGAAGP